MNQTVKSIVKRSKVLHTFARMLMALKTRLAFPVRGRGNRIINKGVFLQVKIDIEGNNNTIDVAEGAFLTNMMIYIRGNNNFLRVGAYCKFKGGCVWFEDYNGAVIIGDHTSIESAHVAVTEPGKRITIGEDCMLSAGIDIRTGDSHSILDKESGKRINYAQDVTIGNHVWVGLNAVILKGVSIGNNSIISTNAVVTHSVPDHSIAAGIPAKVIKSNIDWLRERTYSPDA